MKKIDILDKELLKILNNLKIISKKKFKGLLKGEKLSKKKGVSIEFCDYKQYVFGDDIRFLDWNVYSRLEKLFIKLFQEEEDINIYFILDKSKSMEFGGPLSKLEYAKKIIAILSYIALINYDRVSIITFSNNLEEYLPLIRGRKKIYTILEFLQRIKVSENNTQIYKSLKNIAKKIKDKNGIVLILSDFMDKDPLFKKGFNYFIKNKDLIIIQILSEEEIDPKLEGDLNLIDIEDKENIEISIDSYILKLYKKYLKIFREDIKKWCNLHNSYYIYTINTQSLEKFILYYLKNIGIIK